jgi:CRISPR/Cas system-associated exonuclease Cas4 (RecB family)
MRPILETLANYLSGDGERRLEDTWIVLPNRRSGLFLQRHLAHHSSGVNWSPRIMTINEFISELSGLGEIEPVESVFALYDIYRAEVANPEPLDEFYHWGERMLADFDEIDKYLVDAGMLFRNLLDLKELEDPLAGLDQQQIKFIRQFWAGFHEGGDTSEKTRFLQIWELLPRLYHGLREKLHSRDCGYQGMQYRQVVEFIDKGLLEVPEGNVIVAGFNALNGCEKHIFNWLKNQGAEFFWDFDHAYLGDPDSEAGRFMRDNLKSYPPNVELESFRGLGDEKEIRIFELPSDVLQAKTVYRILEENRKVSPATCTETAVVLCDEELLMPVITSLPDHIEELNITMGYPLKITPLFGFVDALLRMQRNARKGRNGVDQFYHKDVMTVMLHPYFRGRDGTGEGEIVELINRSNMIYVDRDSLAGELENNIFRKVDGFREMLGYLREIFQQILDKMAGEGPTLQQQLDREFIFHMLIHLNKLEIATGPGKELTAEMFERLFRKIISGVRIPFEGEPLVGLQLMGILETRLLDFKHVVLLSMNEEIMPAGHHPYTFVPYSIRKAYGMPAREEKDAIYAYYFFRLLQRAEKVDLLFNSGSEGMRTGEMSRYLHQLVFKRGIRIIRPGMDITAVPVRPLVIQRSEATDAILNGYAGVGASEKYLSPSAINTFMDCSLKFYLRYLAGIGEPEEVLEEIDAAGFGTVVHETVRMLYQELADRKRGVITREDLEDLLQGGSTPRVLRENFIRHHFKGKRTAVIEGRNMIAYRVMYRYLEKIIQTDLRIVPFTLISAEQTYTQTIPVKLEQETLRIRLGGKIDRVDKTGDLIRVIDYKTGNTSMRFPSLESLFDFESGTRNGAAFQTLLYAWLVEKLHPGQQILPGLYAMRELYKPDFDPALAMGTHPSRIRVGSFSEVEEEFVALLKETLSRIFHPTEPFVQTENLMKCRICDFATICSRNQI